MLNSRGNAFLFTKYGAGFQIYSAKPEYIYIHTHTTIYNRYYLCLYFKVRKYSANQK